MGSQDCYILIAEKLACNDELTKKFDSGSMTVSQANIQKELNDFI